MKRFPLPFAFALFLVLSLSGCVVAAEPLFQTEAFSVSGQNGKLIFAWEASGELKKLTLDPSGAAKLSEFVDDLHGKAEEIEFESFGDESVESFFINSAEGEYRLRADSFARFWRSGAFKYFLVLSPVKGEDQSRERDRQEFTVYHHHSELVEREQIMVRMDDGQEVVLDVTPSDEYGEKFMEFRQVLAGFAGQDR